MELCALLFCVGQRTYLTEQDDMAEKLDIQELDQVVVRFSGDSGDGMQLAGNIFSTVSATVGNGISTFPDYPADIRAPQGSLTGVSGFQVHIGAGKSRRHPRPAGFADGCLRFPGAHRCRKGLHAG